MQKAGTDIFKFRVATHYKAKIGLALLPQSQDFKTNISLLSTSSFEGASLGLVTEVLLGLRVIAKPNQTYFDS